MKVDLIKDNKNRVTVYVWKSNINEGSIGHVSLQTYNQCGKGIYASWWPNWDCKTLDLGSGKGRNLGDYDIDKASCKAEADLIIDFYSLNVEEIERAFSNFKLNDMRWCLRASSIFLFKENSTNVMNCSSMVAYLLEIGGIKNLVKQEPYWAITTSAGAGALGMAMGAAATFATGGAVLLFAGVGALGGAIMNYNDWRHHSITPNDIGKLVVFAKKQENSKFNLIEVSRNTKYRSVGYA